MSLKPSERNTYLYLLAIIAIATILRLFRLDYQSLWYDELHSIIPSNPRFTLASLIEYCKLDQPPAFFLMLYGWFKIFSYSEYTGRLLAAVIGIAGVIAMFFLGREVRNNQVGLVAAGFTSINWFHIYFSQEVRFYSLLFLATALSYLFFIRCYKYNNLVNYIGYSVCSILLLYTHYFGMLVLVTQLITFIILILFFQKRDTKFIISGLVSGVFILLAFSPWIPTVLKDNQIQSFWIQKPKVFFPVVYLYVYLGKDPYLSIVSVVLGGLVIKYIYTLYRQQQVTSDDKVIKVIFAVLALWIMLSYAIPYIYSITVLPLLHERYTIVTLPALILFFAWGWSLVTSKKIRSILIITVLISTSINFIFFNEYYTKIYKTQFREISRDVIRANTSNAKIYSDGAFYFQFYFDFFNSKNKVIDSYGADLEKELASDASVWVMEPSGLQGVYEKNQRFLDQNFIPTKKFSYKDISATFYERKK